MVVCDSGTRSNKVTSDSFYWGTCHWKMPFLAPEMQQVLAGILAAILWTYFQGGRMCFKKMKSDEIELLRSDCRVLFCNNSLGGNSWCYLVPFYDVILPIDHISLTFLCVLNVRSTCKCLRYSETFGRISSVQWRKVGKNWMLQLFFRRFLCVRIEIDQL